jgi:hypothetical protein
MKSQTQNAAAPKHGTPNQIQTSRNSNNGFDFNVGGGPVGPLFVGLAFWLRRRKNRKQ